ncbi:MAG: hypothetical protein JXQ72_11670 [Anaerolineae bacterium]|nr:hypothetical protein [Anaerolineae bacterium]
MINRWVRIGVGCLGVILGLVGCSDPVTVDDSPTATVQTPPATPATDVLQTSGTSTSGAHLHLTLPAIRLPHRASQTPVQLFLVMADPHGTYSYLLYPANRQGDTTDKFDLADYPIELSITGQTETVVLWILALHNTRYEVAEQFGIDALAASLGIGFRNWLRDGDPEDDPLAAVVAASDGALFEWFAGIEVLGQHLCMFEAKGWTTAPASLPDSLQSEDGGLSAVYTLQHIPAGEMTPIPSATPTEQ